MPIELRLELMAVKTTIRLKLNNNWYGNYAMKEPGKFTSHAYYLDKHLQKQHKWVSNLHEIIPLTNLDPKYTVIPEDDLNIDTVINNLDVNSITIYTDGSLKKSPSIKTGAGVLIVQNQETIFEQSYSLGSLPSVYQCELFAINQAAVWLDKNKIDNQVIYIFSDSQAVLLSLKKHNTNSLLIKDTCVLINKINQNNEIKLIKVPGHKNIKGNVRADKLANLGSNDLPIGPEPFIDYSYRNIINDVFSVIKNKHIKALVNADISDKGKTPIHNYLLKYGYKLPFNNKSSLKTFTEVMTGHNHLAYSASIRDNSIVPDCKHCLGVKETSEHFLGVCPAYSMLRLRFFNRLQTNIDYITKNYSTHTIIKFITLSKRMEDDYVVYYVD